MYADDIVIMADNEIKLQNSIGILYEWCLKWKLKLNINKTKALHFRPKRAKPTRFTFMYGEDTIEKVDEYKYLGVIFDYSLSYEQCIEVLAGSSGRALGAVQILT